MEPKVVGVLHEPRKRGGSIEVDLKRRSAWRRDVDGTARVVLTETGWSADSQNLFDGFACIELAADDFSLALDAAKRRNDEQRNTLAEGSSLEHSPGFCGSGHKKMIFPVGSSFGNYKGFGFLALAQATGGQQNAGNSKLVSDCGKV